MALVILGILNLVSEVILMEYEFSEELADRHNQYVSKLLSNVNRRVPVSMVTSSSYKIVKE